MHLIIALRFVIRARQRAFVFMETRKSSYQCDATSYNSIVLHIDQFCRDMDAAKRMEISDHRAC